MDDMFHHVRDSGVFEFPGFLGGDVNVPFYMEGWFTKFVFLQVVSGLLTLGIFAGLARKVRQGDALSSKFWNFWEMLALYIRDEVVRPTIGDPDHDEHQAHGPDAHGTDTHGNAVLHADIDGDPISTAGIAAGSQHFGPDDLSGKEPVQNPDYAFTHQELGAHPADRFVPLIWTFFFYVLFNNLLGLIPGFGAATGSLSVTIPLALCVITATIYYGVKKMGFGGFLKNLAPQLDGLPGPMQYILPPLLYAIEAIGFLIKHSVLAVRLFANMFGGHMVLGVLLSFIVAPAIVGTMWELPVGVASITAQTLITLLELLVAFLQAYIFAFLATLFIATALHHH